MDRWTPICQKSFDEMKSILQKRLRLGYFNKDNDLYIFADASDIGYGVLLTQTNIEERKFPLLERKHVPIGCLSGLFKGSEKNWDISSRELYPFLIALNKFHHYLHRKIPFNLITDNRNLSHIIKPKGYLDIEKAHTRNRVYR